MLRMIGFGKKLKRKSEGCNLNTVRLNEQVLNLFRYMIVMKPRI